MKIEIDEELQQKIFIGTLIDDQKVILTALKQTVAELNNRPSEKYLWDDLFDLVKDYQRYNDMFKYYGKDLIYPSDIV
jgi:hypothetical protein